VATGNNFMIQLAIREAGYLAALEKLLSRNAGWSVTSVETPDTHLPSVMVVDDTALARLPKPLAHPEFVVLITHNDPERLHEAWEAGIRSVVFYNDPVSTAVLAIMAATLRIPKSRPAGGSTVGTTPRGSTSCNAVELPYADAGSLPRRGVRFL
jgi:DNA-binding NarL/FixJ family response regulator